MALRVRQIGLRGVNVVDSPLHLHDEDLAWAQNAQVSFADGFPALVKRPGLASFAGGLAVPIAGLTSVPLPDPDASTEVKGIVVVHYPDNGWTAVQSTNGTTWSSLALPAAGLWSSSLYMPLPVYRGRAHYPDSTLSEIYAYDGSTAALVTTLASTVTLGDGNLWTLDRIVALAADDAFLYVAADYYRSGYAATVVWRFDESYGSVALGETFSTLAFTGAIVEGFVTLTTWNGEVWAATTEAVGHRPINVRRIAPTGTTWTLDDSFGGTGPDRDYMPQALRGGGDRLLLAAGSNNMEIGGTRAILRMRSATGGWSTLEESPTIGGAYGLIKVSGSGATVARYREDTRETALRHTGDYATFVDIAGPSEMWNGRWVGGYDLAGTRYALFDGGVVAVTASSAVIVHPPTIWDIPRGIGGWQ